MLRRPQGRGGGRGRLKGNSTWRQRLSLPSLSWPSARGGDGRLFVPRRKDFLERKDRYRSDAINTLLPAALDQLEALGFISQDIGHITESGDRRRTVISPGPALRELIGTYGLIADHFRHERAGDEIVLKERGGEMPIPYTDDGDTRRMRAEMQDINAFLRDADIGILIGGADDPLNDIDLTKRKLRRAFSQGSFAEGGRLFGGFWQDMKGEQRRNSLLIDGQPVVELDLSAAGLRILYGLAGATPPDGDLYCLPDLSRRGARRREEHDFGPDVHRGRRRFEAGATSTAHATRPRGPG